MTAADWRLTKARLIGGTWEGILTGPEGDVPPKLAATWLDRDLAAPEVVRSAEVGGWHVRLTLPPDVLTDGVHTVLIGEPGGATLAAETFVCGDLLEDDLRAEIALLRAELDMLKRAFRRHCLDTM